MEVIQGDFEGDQLSLSVQIVRAEVSANWTRLVVDLLCGHDGSNVDRSCHDVDIDSNS